MLRNCAISASTRMYQYSSSDGLFVGLGLTYMGSVELVAHVVLITLAWLMLALLLALSHKRTVARRDDRDFHGHKQSTFPRKKVYLGCETR